MPEGHTIHREARIQTRHFAGETLEVWSPQGRFTGGAQRLNGQQLVSVDAWGKHLFYVWGNDLIMHVHLGLFGRFRRFESVAPDPTDGTRLAMSGSSATQYLSGPTVCAIVTPDERDSIVADLGPDPLRPDAHPEAVDRMESMLARRTVPIATALLDQSVIAGIGNVYRSEILFLTGVNPMIRARDIERDRIECIWREALRQLRVGEKAGRIITTEPADVGRARRSEIARGERTYVYKRRGEPCRRCGTTIERAELASRKVWWCPGCQRG